MPTFMDWSKSTSVISIIALYSLWLGHIQRQYSNDEVTSIFICPYSTNTFEVTSIFSWISLHRCQFLISQNVYTHKTRPPHSYHMCFKKDTSHFYEDANIFWPNDNTKLKTSTSSKQVRQALRIKYRWNLIVINFIALTCHVQQNMSN